MNRTEEEQVIADGMYDKLRDELLKRDLSNTENYDKSILTLSSASLGLSVSAIRFIVPLDTATCLCLLIAGWVLLLISILTSLWAYLVSNKAIEVQLSNANDYYKKGIEEAFSRDNFHLSLNTILNRVTGLSFCAALVTIISFIIINIV